MKYLKLFEDRKSKRSEYTDYQNKIIFSTKRKLDKNIGNFFITNHHGTLTIYYLRSYSWYFLNFYISVGYCTFNYNRPNKGYLEEHSEQFTVEQIKNINFLTVEKLFKEYRTEVIELYKMISKFDPNDVYHKNKKIPFLQEFVKIDDHEMNEITTKIEAEKYNL